MTAVDTTFHVVLFEPEIPPNTGNVISTHYHYKLTVPAMPGWPPGPDWNRGDGIIALLAVFHSPSRIALSLTACARVRGARPRILYETAEKFPDIASARFLH